MRDLVGDIIAYENGSMEDEKVIEFFQYLVDSGIVWSLQGHYGRTAWALHDKGLITIGEREEGE